MTTSLWFWTKSHSNEIFIDNRRRGSGLVFSARLLWCGRWQWLMMELRETWFLSIVPNKSNNVTDFSRYFWCDRETVSNANFIKLSNPCWIFISILRLTRPYEILPISYDSFSNSFSWIKNVVRLMSQYSTYSVSRRRRKIAPLQYWLYLNCVVKARVNVVL